MSVNDLHQHFGILYSAHVLGVGNRDKAMAAFRAALKEDPEMRRQAEAHRGRLLALQDKVGGDLARRDFVGAQQLDYLQKGLAE